MRFLKIHRLSAVAALAWLTAGPIAQAEPAGSAPGTADPTFGSRTENPDGSVAMTVGRRLPTEWEAKVGTDFNLPASDNNVPSENLLRGSPSGRSTGAIWGNLTMPSPAPQIWDKTTIEARIDSASDQGKVGATLSRSVPIGQDVTVSVQNSYSVVQALPDRQPASTLVPLMATPLATGPAESPQIWQSDQLIRLNVASSGTAVSAGGTASTVDEQWHKKFSVEQSVFGPLKVTTSVEDIGSAGIKKSVMAAFKRVW